MGAYIPSPGPDMRHVYALLLAAALALGAAGWGVWWGLA